MRNRIRTTLVYCDEKSLIPHYIHGIEGDAMSECLPKSTKSDCNDNVLPVLALNEVPSRKILKIIFNAFAMQVFIGESLSARVSHLQMRLNGSFETTNLKCSGVCVATGTGSTSWHLSINRLPVQSVEELLTLLKVENRKTHLAAELSDKYNKNLIFSAGNRRFDSFRTVFINASHSVF